tara:strand:+ start:7638 stop:8420 length:783 start_codon:yes stop_codon:yes gene_type:complete
MVNIGFIGTGNMATSIIRSLKSEDCSIIASDKNRDKLVKEELQIQTTDSNKEVVEKSDILFLCVKPKDIDDVLIEIKELVKDKVVISIAAGIKIESIENVIGADKKVVRVMPNINCFVGEVAAAYSFNGNVENKDKEVVHKLLNAAGLAIEVNEEKMDSVTALSGSGPAFVAYLLEAFAQAGEKQGLDKEISYKLALQTFFGTSKMLKEGGMSAEELIKKVSSPGGTTIEGLEVLEKSGVKDIIDKTIGAAARRSKELGK